MHHQQRRRPKRRLSGTLGWTAFILGPPLSLAGVARMQPPAGLQGTDCSWLIGWTYTLCRSATWGERNQVEASYENFYDGFIQTGDIDIIHTCEDIDRAALRWISLLQAGDDMVHPTEGSAVGSVKWNFSGDPTHGIIDVDFVSNGGSIAAHEGAHAALDTYDNDEVTEWLDICYPGEN